MPEIGTSGLMSGDGKRGVGHRPQATAPILDSTKSISELLLRAFYVVHSPELSSRNGSQVSPSSARTALRSAIRSLVKRPCFRAFRFPLGAPHLAAPPCIRQRDLPC